MSLKANPPAVVPDLLPEEQTHLVSLKTYFGYGKNLKANTPIRIARDRSAFHYHDFALSETVKLLGESERRMYLAEHPINSLYFVGTALVFRTLCGEIANAVDGSIVDDPTKRGSEILLADLDTTQTSCLTVLYGLIRVLAGQIAGTELANLERIRRTVMCAPSPNSVAIPAFINVDG